MADDDEKEDLKLERQKFVQSTHLYDPLTPPDSNKWPIVYHSIYNISFYGFERLHPFDAGKWGRIYKRLIQKEGGLLPSSKSIYQPLEASKNDLLVVHTKRYLKSLRWSGVVAMVMEVPPVACLPNCLVDKKALKPFRYHVGGTVLAAQLALNHGWAINLGGGFHHCSADRGGGFCAYADITLALEFLFIRGSIAKSMIIDLDAHQGNGHERDFKNDERVYILDMYNGYIYPGDSFAERVSEAESDRAGVTQQRYTFVSGYPKTRRARVWYEDERILGFAPTSLGRVVGRIRATRSDPV